MSIMLNSMGLSGPGHMASIKLGRKKSEAHYPGVGGGGGEQHLLLPTSLQNKRKYLICERNKRKEGGRGRGVTT